MLDIQVTVLSGSPYRIAVKGPQTTLAELYTDIYNALEDTGAYSYSFVLCLADRELDMNYTEKNIDI